MSEMKLVAPFKVSGNHHKRLLGLLKQKPPEISGTLPILHVPVPLDVDVTSLIEANSKQLPENGSGLQPGLSEDLPGASALTEDDGGAETTEIIPGSFVELGAFLPKNRLEQITTVFFQDFPALKVLYVERVFSMALETCPLENSKQFRFSVIAESINDTRGVFVRFPTVQMTQWAKTMSPRFFPGVTAIFEEKLDLLVVPEAPEASKMPETTSDPSVGANIALILANKRLYSRGSGRSGTEDLDEVMQYYKTYKVENSELVEVPKELKQVIVRDIIKFRAKVLTIEREARKAEIEKERRKAKARLTLIFEGIKAAAGTEAGTRDLEKTDDGSSEQDPPKINPLDALTDEEYDEYIKKKQTEQLEAQYLQKYKEMITLERQEKAFLLEQLHSAREYEQNLIENNLAHMEEMKMFQDLDVDPSAARRVPAAASGKLKMYYTNHSEYLRLRNLDRSKEEQKDEVDRAEEAREKTLDVPSSAAFAPIVPNKKPVSKKESDSQNGVVKAADLVVSALSKSNLEAVKEKISSLVEEYLGIREDLLIDFIYEYVLEHNLARGDDLVTELQETLDEDSKTVVEQLHEFVVSL